MQKHWAYSSCSTNEPAPSMVNDRRLFTRYPYVALNPAKGLIPGHDPPINITYYSVSPSQGSGKPARGALLLSHGRRLSLAVSEVPGADQLHADRPLPALAQGRPRQGLALVSRGYGAQRRRGALVNNQERTFLHDLFITSAPQDGSHT